MKTFIQFINENVDNCIKSLEQMSDTDVISYLGESPSNTLLDLVKKIS